MTPTIFTVSLRRDGTSPRVIVTQPTTRPTTEASRGNGSDKAASPKSADDYVMQVAQKFLVYRVTAETATEAISQATEKMLAERRIALLAAEARRMNVETIRGVN